MVRIRLTSLWYRLRESLWFLPSLLTLGGALLALGLVELDRHLALEPRGNRLWAFGGGTDGARGVLQAIAGSLITVTGTVFSITIVALQLASSQFTPRVLRTFTRDRGVQAVLGVFIGTFTYALLVLRAVRGRDGDAERFVPSVAVVGAIVLALLSIGCLIYFIHHMAQSIRVSAVVERVVRDGAALLAHRYPTEIGEPLSASGAAAALPLDPPAEITANGEGYLQVIAADAIFGLSGMATLTIQIDPVVGDFVLRSERLASLWPASAATDDVIATVRQSCVLGAERTLEADADLPLRQLADVAVKALSPGINDPTTAVTCVDRLAQLLLRAAAGGQPPAVYRREGSPVTLVVAAPSFARLAETAFGQIRHYGADNPAIAEHLLGVIGRVAGLAPPECRPALRWQADLALAASRDRIGSGHERARVEAAASWLRRGDGVAAPADDGSGNRSDEGAGPEPASA
jgi:uncharacterized membrane protein